METGLLEMAVRKLGLLDRPRDEHLQHIVELAAAATGAAAATFSVAHDGTMLLIAQSAEVVPTLRLNQLQRRVIETSEPRLLHCLAADTDRRLTGLRVREEPVRTLRMVPVHSPERYAIGTLCIFGTEHLPGADKLALDLPRRFAALIEDSLWVRERREQSRPQFHSEALAA